MVVLPVAEATRRGLSLVDMGPSNVHVLPKSTHFNLTSVRWLDGCLGWAPQHRSP